MDKQQSIHNIDIELPPLPSPLGIVNPDSTEGMMHYTTSDLQDYAKAYARAAIEADRKRRGEPVGWMYEDEIPDNYPYDAMFPYSKVDGVRMFPVYAPQPAEQAAWHAGWEASRDALPRITDADIQRIMLNHGYTVKPGHDDLKPYVYAAARELIALAQGREP